MHSPETQWSDKYHPPATWKDMTFYITVTLKAYWNSWVFYRNMYMVIRSIISFSHSFCFFNEKILLQREITYRDSKMFSHASSGPSQRPKWCTLIHEYTELILFFQLNLMIPYINLLISCKNFCYFKSQNHVFLKQEVLELQIIMFTKNAINSQTCEICW